MEMSASGLAVGTMIEGDATFYGTVGPSLYVSLTATTITLETSKGDIVLALSLGVILFGLALGVSNPASVILGAGRVVADVSPLRDNA